MPISSLLAIAPLLPASISPGSLTGELIGIAEYAIAIAMVIIVFDYVFGWLERKVVAKIQKRHGPTYAGKYGLLQNMADILKLMSKQHVAPANSDRPMFLATLPAMLALTLFLVMLIPFSPTFSGSSSGFVLLIVLVLVSFMPLVIFMNGFASGNKFSAISAERSVVMLLSYEIPLVLVVATTAALTGSYSLNGIVGAQSQLWYVVLMPIGFVIFFIAMLAELERPPFDMREADSELIAGWLTDVSPPYYMLALFLDYSRMLLGSMLIAILFFGGWNGPVLPPIVWLLIKVFAIAFFIMIVRVTMVRMRIDRLLRFGWLILLPLAFVNLIVTYVLLIG